MSNDFFGDPPITTVGDIVADCYSGDIWTDYYYKWGLPFSPKVDEDFQALRDCALSLADTVHRGKTRRDNTPDIDHAIRVSTGQATPQREIIGLLHYTIEDSDYITPLYLKNLGFDEQIIRTVDALTRREGESYSEYIYRVSLAGPDAIAVKIADIKDNLCSLEKDRTDKRVRYELSLMFLEALNAG